VILELAGIKVVAPMEARSVMPALRGEPWMPRDHVFAEHCRDGILQETEYMSMVRSNEWKLVHFLHEPFGQLFDLVNDPKEIDNLWDDPACQEIKQHLLHILLEWRISSQLHTRDWAAACR